MKKLLSLALILISFASYSQVKVVGNLTTNGVALYPTHIDSLGYGGFRIAYDTTERNAITCLRRKFGMAVYTQKDSTIWILKDSNCINTWVAFTSGVSLSKVVSDSNLLRGLININTSNIALKVNISDTANMLIPYLRKSDSTIANRVTANTTNIANNLAKEITDSSLLAARISLKVDSIKRKPGSDSVFWYKNGVSYFAFRDTTISGVTSITGTFNQVIASSPTGAVTLSLPQNINTSSNPTFNNLTLSAQLQAANINVTGNASGTAAGFYNSYPSFLYGGASVLQLKNQNDSNVTLDILNSANTAHQFRFYGNGNSLQTGTDTVGKIYLTAPNTAASADTFALYWNSVTNQVTKGLRYGGGGGVSPITSANVTTVSTATYTTVPTDRILEVTYAGASITLGAASASPFTTLEIKNKTNSSFSISNLYIQDVSGFPFSYGGVHLINDSTTWYVISRDQPLYNGVAPLSVSGYNIRADTSTANTGLATKYQVGQKGAVNTVKLTTSGVLYSTPNYSTISHDTASVSITLASQSPYTIFNRGSGSGTPSFNYIDSNYFNNQFANLVRSVVIDSPLVAGYGIAKTVSGTSITVSLKADTATTQSPATGPFSSACPGGSYCKFIANLSTAPSSYTVGMRVFVKFSESNVNNNDSINFNGLGNIPITKNGTTPILAGDITTNQINELVYDGANFQIIGQISTAGTISGNLAFTGGSGTGNISLNASNYSLAHVGDNSFPFRYGSFSYFIVGYNPTEALYGLTSSGTSQILWIWNRTNKDIRFGGGNGGTEAGRINNTNNHWQFNTTNDYATATFGGSVSNNYVTKSASYTATSSDYGIIETTSGTTVTLPTAIGISGTTYNIVNASSAAITVATTSSQTIGNYTTATTLSIPSDGSYTLVSDNSNWKIKSKF